jgi:heparan-alpha-glucosaminide N-acetyltransferase
MNLPTPWPRLSRARITSIDAFRALTVLLMILVNEWHGVAGLPPWLRHYPAEADAMSFADAVFPAFLFIVGMSIPLALQQKLAAGRGPTLQGVALRSVGLLVLGVLMVNAEGGHHAAAMPLPIGVWALLSYLGFFLVWGSLRGGPALAAPWRLAGAVLLLALALVWRGGADGSESIAPQWWGILGLIGWAYGLASLIYLLVRGHLGGLLLAAAACLAWWLWVQPSGHATHTLIVLAGAITALLFLDTASSLSLAQRRWMALGLALLMAVLAALLRPEYRISKIHATPSWALYSAAASVLIFLALHGWLEGRQRELPGWRWLAPVATNPLLAYLLPFVIGAAMSLLALDWPPAPWRVGVAGVLWGCAFAALVLVIVRMLSAQGVRLRI